MIDGKMWLGLIDGMLRWELQLIGALFSSKQSLITMVFAILFVNAIAWQRFHTITTGLNGFAFAVQKSWGAPTNDCWREVEMTDKVTLAEEVSEETIFAQRRLF